MNASLSAHEVGDAAADPVSRGQLGESVRAAGQKQARAGGDQLRSCAGGSLTPARARCAGRAHASDAVCAARRSAAVRVVEHGASRGQKVAALRTRTLRVPRTGLHEQAANKLRTLIVRGGLAPGLKFAELFEGFFLRAAETLFVERQVDEIL